MTTIRKFSGRSVFLKRGFEGKLGVPNPWAMDRQWSTACQEPGCAAGGERQVSQRRFICIYSHSPSLTLPLELCLPSDKQGHNKCKALESPLNHPPTPTSSSRKNCHPWNWSLVPKWLGATGIKNKMVEEKLGSHFHALLNINNIMYCDFSWSKVMLLINLDSQRETEKNRGSCKFFFVFPVEHWNNKSNFHTFTIRIMSLCLSTALGFCNLDAPENKLKVSNNNKKSLSIPNVHTWYLIKETYSGFCLSVSLFIWLTLKIDLYPIGLVG